MIFPEHDPDLFGDCLNVSTNVRHCFPGEVDMSQVYVEQSEKQADVATVRWCVGMGEFVVTFLNAAALDDLSLFFAEAAQQLRVCTTEKSVKDGEQFP